MTVEQRFLNALGYAKVASFDMFDTLAHRTVHPRAVQYQVVLHVARRFSISPIRAQELRDAAWDIAASARSSIGLDHEARFGDWMRQWVWLVSLEPGSLEIDVESAAEDIIGLELELEAESLRVNDDVCELVRQAKSLGKTVVVTSDMYLEMKHIEYLLGVLGIDVHRIFVSSEYGETKRSGRLFRRVAKELEVAAGDIVHIGDNVDADLDGAKAADLDIMAVLYDKRARVKRMRQKEFAWNQFVATGDAGELVRLAAEDGSASLRRGYTGYGHDVFGSVIATFVKRVAEIAESYEIDRVYFMAREGFLLKMVYDIYARSLDDSRQAVPSDYLCVSRLTTLRATSGSYGLREMALGTVHVQTSVRKALGTLVANDETLSRIAARYGFDNIDLQFDQMFHPMFHQLVRDEELLAVIGGNKAAAQSDLAEYLDTIGFFGNRNVLVVDVGWAGQIQESFEMFLKQTGRPVNVYGAYLATNHVAELRRAGGHSIIPVVADRNIHDFYSNSLFRNVDLLETICRAPHGSVIGYDKGLPIESSGEKRSLEETDDVMLSQMQKGVALYAENYFKMASVLCFKSGQTLSTAVGSLLRLHRYPSSQEAALHLAVGHVASHWVGDKAEASPSGLKAQWRASHWKEGFMMARFGLAALALLSFRAAIRREHVIPRSGGQPMPDLRRSRIAPMTCPEQEIYARAHKTYQANQLVQADDMDTRVPFLRDRHLVTAALLARIHAFRNGYKLVTPLTLSMRYVIKRKLFVECPNATRAIHKARHIIWRLKTRIAR